jgi:hypothetical protein
MGLCILCAEHVAPLLVAQGWGLLRDGPGLYRFSEVFCLYAQPGLLCRAHQVEPAAPAALLASGGQEYRCALGSGRDPGVFESASVYPDALRRVSYFDAEPTSGSSS